MLKCLKNEVVQTLLLLFVMSVFIIISVEKKNKTDRIKYVTSGRP